MAVTSQQSEVLGLIDGMRNQIVDTISQLVRIRSVNPGYPGVDYDDELGGETAANQFLAERYRQMDLEVDTWEEAPGRANLVGSWRGTGEGKSLLHNGHIDTVPAGRIENWTSGDPLSGKVDNGRIYGRGTCDMKGALVCQMFAIRAIQQSGLRLAGDLFLSATVVQKMQDR